MINQDKRGTMKFIVLSIFSIISFTSSANYKWDLERNLKKLTRQVQVLATQNADLLSVQELRSSIRTLKDLKSTLLGMNRDYPTPVCSQESAERMRNTFKGIKIFAYSVKGPELSKEASIQYAIDWTNTYPCNYSEYFRRSYLTVKRYAFAKAGGLNLSNEQSIAYASEMTPLFCGDSNFKNDFYSSYKLARYEMDMTESQAIAYAKRIVERDHFSCRWDDRIVEDNVDLRTTRFDVSDICISPIIIPGMPVVTPGLPGTPRSPRTPRR